MPSLLRSIFILFFLGLMCSSHVSANGPSFTENKGQWHSNVLYKTDIQGNIGYLDKEGFTFVMMEDSFYVKLHDWVGNRNDATSGASHVLKMKFLGADLSQNAIPQIDIGTTENYFLGNNSTKWARNVRSYKRVKIPNIYPGIAVQYGFSQSNLKYDFILEPNADPNLIQVEFRGQENLFLDPDGSLIAKTSVGAFTELAPFAYQLNSEGQIEKVSCQFVLTGHVVSYYFPEGYDTSRELVIDPEISFSTYIGSPSNSFGFTASYDADGNLYAGAIVYGATYPTTAGAFQTAFGTGTVDCGITKFNADGTELLYSTYVGGSGNEAPHSIVVNGNNELYILGTTSSFNFPTTAGSYQTDHAGGNSFNASAFWYDNGIDMFVVKLNANGSDLLAGTYVGGSGNDGVGTGGVFENNYGDQFRGEIVIDDVGNAYVASVTTSGNFPIVNGFSSTIGGLMSGVIYKLSSNLENLIWSTFSGGSFSETAVGLHLAADNSVYFTGGTTSTNLPVSPGAYQSSLSGGVDGYIGHISADGSELLACTYNGTLQFDQNYFVQLDVEGFVYVIGQTEGYYPISGDVYNNPNSGQYIQKLSPDLTTSIWSTQVGSGSGEIDFSPSAFLVSYCGQIYISGWGGALNGSSSTNALPITNNAFQSTTDGEDFYFLTLEADASELIYGSYFGGNVSAEHVDGGTSRFDKNGTIYQAVCAGCFGNDDFPTQEGVWSETNGSGMCNLAVMKFNLASVSALADIDGPDIVCPGMEFDLTNQSIGANTFLWNMGDGFTTTDEETSYSFDAPGMYTITLYAEDSNGCLSPDSTTVSIQVAELPIIETSNPEPICAGENVQLNASGTADQYTWSPAVGLSATNIPNPVFSGNSSQVYTVIGSTACGADTSLVTVVVGNLDISISEDTDICPGESTQLIANGGETYTWTPEMGLSDANISNPMASPMETTTYQVEILDSEGCTVIEEVEITILPPPPVLDGDVEYVSCNGAAVPLSVSGAFVYSWTPATGLNFSNISNPIAHPQFSTTYTVTGSNICGEDQLEVNVFVNEISVSIDVDTTVCYSQSFSISASGGDSYIWQPSELFANNKVNPAQAMLDVGQVISVTGFDSLGCAASDAKYIRLFPRADVRAGNDRVINYGDEILLESFSIYPIVWENSPYLSCFECKYPYAYPPETTTFYATIISPDGCNEVDSVKVFVRGEIYVPNAFTPDGDGLNDMFRAEGIDITEFKMEIFDRWGNLVFISEQIQNGWNGSFRGDGYYCPPDLYQYRIVAKEHQGDYFELKGHVTLLR